MLCSNDKRKRSHDQYEVRSSLPTQKKNMIFFYTKERRESFQKCSGIIEEMPIFHAE